MKNLTNLKSKGVQLSNTEMKNVIGGRSIFGCIFKTIRVKVGEMTIYDGGGWGESSWNSCRNS